MRIVTLKEAHTHFSQLLDNILQGQEIIITIDEKPVAKLKPFTEKPKRRFGVLKGKIELTKDFDTPLSIEFRTNPEV